MQNTTGKIRKTASEVFWRSTVADWVDAEPESWQEAKCLVIDKDAVDKHQSEGETAQGQVCWDQDEGGADQEEGKIAQADGGANKITEQISV